MLSRLKKSRTVSSNHPDFKQRQDMFYFGQHIKKGQEHANLWSACHTFFSCQIIKKHPNFWI